jgi:hypothetical protein
VRKVVTARRAGEDGDLRDALIEVAAAAMDWATAIDRTHAG